MTITVTVSINVKVENGETKGGFPANSVSEVKTIIDPTTSEA